MSTDSLTRNEHNDIIHRQNMSKWSALFLGDAPRDPYNEPLTAASEWWDGVPVDEILIVAGAHDILVDDIKAMAIKLEVGLEKPKTILPIL